MDIQSWDYPNWEERQFAYTPIIFRAYTSDDSEEVELPIYRGRGASGEPETVLHAMPMNGVASFDVAPIVRSWLARELDTMIRQSDKTEEPLLYTNFSVIIDIDEETTVCSYFVQNAVSQTGADGSKTWGQDDFRITQDGRKIVLAYWDDEAAPQVTVAFRNSMTIGGKTFDAYKTYNFYITGVGPDTWWSRLNLASYGYTFEDRRSNRCGGSLVRWVNRKGGIETYFFSAPSYKVKSAKTTASREIYMEYPEQYRTNREPIAVEGSRRLRLGAYNISAEDMDLLTKMPYSPVIEWYDLSNAMWTGCRVNQFQSEEKSNGTGFTFEIELELPAVRMQFE